MNTSFFIMFSFVFLFLVFCCTIFLLLKYTKLLIKYNRVSKYLYNYLNIITSARYGNLNSKLEDGIDALTIQLTRNTSALLESIKDRDAMINEYIEKEKQSQNLKQDFISSLAHDLKVPIIAQDNTYDLFLNGNLGELSNIQKNAIKNLKISNNDLKNLVVDLLDAHKLDNQEFVLDFEKTNLNDFIKEIIAQNKSILEVQNKKIIFNTQGFYELEIDRFLIKRALNNLIANAIFYSKNSQTINIFVCENDGFVDINVSDQGEGINVCDVNKIFKKYYTSAKKYSNIGAGLGLYIVSKIASAHKGQVRAKNNENKGACFTISLPLGKNIVK